MYRGAGAQISDAYPGEMAIVEGECEPRCEYLALTSTGTDLPSNLIH
jgi:hypothetical protein